MVIHCTTTYHASNAILVSSKKRSANSKPFNPNMAEEDEKCFAADGNGAIGGLILGFAEGRVTPDEALPREYGATNPKVISNRHAVMHRKGASPIVRSCEVYMSAVCVEDGFPLSYVRFLAIFFCYFVGTPATTKDMKRRLTQFLKGAASKMLDRPCFSSTFYNTRLAST